MITLNYTHLSVCLPHQPVEHALTSVTPASSSQCYLQGHVNGVSVHCFPPHPNLEVSSQSSSPQGCGICECLPGIVCCSIQVTRSQGKGMLTWMALRTHRKSSCLKMGTCSKCFHDNWEALTPALELLCIVRNHSSDSI